MSKRGATDQGGKDTGLVFLNEDRSAEHAERASTDVMARRKTAVPKSRRRPGAPGVEALGNIFGSNPSPAFGAPQQQPSTQNSQSNNIFGGLTSFQPQTPPAPVNAPTNGAPSLFGNISQAPTASTPSNNIFGSNASTGFSFGATSNSFNNPFAQHSADQVQNNNTLFATPPISTPFKGFGTTPTQNPDQNLFQPTTPQPSTSPNDQSMVSPPNTLQSQATASNGGTPFTNNSSANQASNAFGTPTPASSSLFAPKSDTPSSTMPYEVHGQIVNSLWAKPGQVDAPPPNRRPRPSTGSASTPAASSGLANSESTDSQNPNPSKSAESSSLFPPKSSDSQTPAPSTSAASSNPFLQKLGGSQALPQSNSAESSSLFGSSNPPSNPPSQSGPAPTFGSKSGFGSATGSFTGFGSHTSSIGAEGRPSSTSNTGTGYRKPSVSDDTEDQGSNLTVPPATGTSQPSNATPKPPQNSSGSFNKLPADGQTPTKSDSAPNRPEVAASEADLPSFAEANLAAADPTAPGAFLVAAQFLNAQGTLENLMHEQGVTFTTEEKQKFLRALQMRFITNAFRECISKANPSNDLSQVCRAYIAQTDEIKAGAYFKVPPFKRKATDSVDTTKTKAARIDSGPQSSGPQSSGPQSRPSSSSPAKPQSKTANLVQGIVDGPSASSKAPATASGAAPPPQTPAKNLQSLGSAAAAPQTAPAKHTFGSTPAFGSKSTGSLGQSTEDPTIWSDMLQPMADSMAASRNAGGPSASNEATPTAFGASSTPQPQTPANLQSFSSAAAPPPQTAPAKHSFGATSSFGAKSTGLFGQSAGNPSSSGTLFGQQPAPSTETSQSTGLFGTPKAAPVGSSFGQPAASSTGLSQSTGLFGAPKATPGGSSFGQPTASSTETSQSKGLFGAPKPDVAPPSWLNTKSGTGANTTGSTNFADQFGKQAKQNGKDALAKAKAKRKAEEFDSDEDNEEEWEKKDKETQSTHARKKTVFGQQGFGFADSPAAKSDHTSSSVFDSPPAANNIFGNVAPTGPSADDDDDDSDDDNNPAQPEPAAPGAGLSLFDRITRKTPSEERRRPEGSQERRHVSPDDGESDGAMSVSGTQPPAPSTLPNVFAKVSQISKKAETIGSSEKTDSTGDNTWKGDSNSPLKFGTAGRPVNGASANDADSEQSTTPSRPFADLTAASTAKPKQRSLFGMDGAADEPPTAGDKTPTPSLFGKASQPSGSLFSPKPGPASAVGPLGSISRASTPAELSDATSVNASEDEGEAGEAQSDMTALSAAERRQEEVLFEVKAKLMQHSKDDKKEPIKTVGTGPLRVLKNRETQAVRMLMRCAPRGQVVLNATLQAGMAFKKKQKSTIQFGAPDPTGSFQMWFVRTGLDSKADELVAMLEQQTPTG